MIRGVDLQRVHNVMDTLHPLFLEVPQCPLAPPQQPQVYAMEHTGALPTSLVYGMHPAWTMLLLPGAENTNPHRYHFLSPIKGAIYNLLNVTNRASMSEWGYNSTTPGNITTSLPSKDELEMFYYCE